MEQDAKILITGANGVLGHGLRHALQERGYRHLLCPNRQELNALDTQQVDDFFLIIGRTTFFILPRWYLVCWAIWKTSSTLSRPTR